MLQMLSYRLLHSLRNIALAKTNRANINQLYSIYNDFKALKPWLHVK